MNDIRQIEFKRNQKLEELIIRLNDLLEPTESKILKKYSNPKYPVILLVGCSRSGSTLLIQWLANTNEFAVPTNFLSRFYKAPYFGALIQQLLYNPDYNYKNELYDFKNEVNFNSDLGKTKGPLSANEFYYFWRNFFKFKEIQFLDKKNLDKINKRKFISELAAIESVLDRPLTLKALIINWNISFVSNLFDKVLFIHIKRDPIFNAQSLLEARKRFYGDITAWYSFKPPEYRYLKDLDPFTQVAGQVYYTNKAIDKGFNSIEDGKKLVVNYEDFCNNPESVYLQILEKFHDFKYRIDPIYGGPESFKVSNEIKLEKRSFNKIEKAYKNFINS